MHATHPPVPVMERILAGLGRHGYEVEMVAVSLASMERLDSALAVLRFGDRVDGLADGVVAGLDVRIDMSGDLCDGRLRRWRITKTFPVQHTSLLAVELDAVVTLRGDISPGFVRRQGQVALAMMRSLVDDAKATLDELRLKHYAPDVRGPIIHLELKVIGDVAVGRSGLAPTGEDTQAVTPEARAIRNAICDRLAHLILPEAAIITAAALAKAQAPHQTLSDRVYAIARYGDVSPTLFERHYNPLSSAHASHQNDQSPVPKLPSKQSH